MFKTTISVLKMKCSFLAALVALLAQANIASAVSYFGLTTSGNLYEVNLDAGPGYGSHALVGNTGLTGNWALSFSPSGTLFGLNQSNSNLYTIDPVTAALTNIGNTALGSAESLTFDSTGRLLTKKSGSGGNWFELDQITAAPTFLSAPVGAGFDSDGLTYNPTALTINGANVPAGNLLAADSGRIFSIDPLTFNAQQVASGTPAMENIAMTSDGRMFANRSDSLYAANSLSPLSWTQIADTSAYGRTYGGASAISSVPESGATLALFGLALVGLGFGRRFLG